ncbi:MAG TPA: FlgD immunoglobulin-like domain containing protein, partial [Cyclobacteriaceae bacterium]
PEFFLSRFVRDVVPSVDHYTWDYTIESNFEKSETTLSWDAQSLGNNEAQLKLYDEEAGELIDMKRVDSYSFKLKGTRKIKIFYSADEKSLAPDISGIGKPYPNPFNQLVTIPFFTGSYSPHVQIIVYDLTGRKVKELINQKQASGFYQLTWDGNDEQGSRVAPGVYLYRFTSSDSKAVTGRLVIK